ncbi:MAG: sigma-70 family RNA polymerase sigma factor [Clostridiales bacterium]|nr:sigma-70 family RNA polymerase sigma factor [Clostridiales bacterium]
MKIIQEEQFINYIRQYERLIFTICMSFARNYHDAEDLAQETFLSASRNIDKFEGENLKAWLTTIAANKCRDYLKSPARNIDSLAQEYFALFEDEGNSPEEIAIKNETTHRVHKMCLRLKEPYRTVAENYFCKNRKLSDASRDTGKSLKTLQTQLYRSKKLLKTLWKEEF